MKKIAIVSVVLLMCIGCASTSTAPADSMAMTSNQSIAEVAMSTGMHNTLVAALKAAGLADMLMQSGSYTVLAPTDAAFAKLPAGTVDMLLKPENKDKLIAVLQYHVIPGTHWSKEVASMSSAKSVSGKTLTIMPMGSGLMIGNANVIKADVPASNGVVHVIDTVLLPPM